MRGAVSNRLGVMAALAIAAAGACTSQPTILPSRDLDRPADLTFVCLGGLTPGAGSPDGGAGTEAGAPEADGATSAEVVLTGRPMRECHPRQSDDPTPSSANRTFAFMPQSSSGELAVVDADHWKLVDLSPVNAGFNQSPLGVLPSQIVTSDDGCRMLTANHGSCDLSLVDPSALLAPTMARDYPTTIPASTGNPVTRSVVPHAKGDDPAVKPLGVLAGEVAFVPHPTSIVPGEQICAADWNWRALVTFPSCDLIALVDLKDGEIVDGAYVRATSTGGFVLEALAGRKPVCAPDCTQGLVSDAGAPEAVEAAAGEGGAEAGGQTDAGADEAGTNEAGVADGGAPEAGTPPPTIVPAKVPLRPGPIAIIPDTGHAYVGMGNGEAILTLDVPLDPLAPSWDHLTLGDAIPLHDRPLGTSRLRLSIDPYADKSNPAMSPNAPHYPGRFIGNVEARHYLYAVARDGSVRIVQVATLPESECETNIDPLNPPQGVTLLDACIPVEPPPYTHRRPTALGPGVRLPSPAIDVAVADIRPQPEDQSESTVEGAHAWALTASGAIYLINIEPVRRLTSYVEPDGTVLACTTPTSNQCEPEPEPQPNVLRNRNVASYTLALDPTAGPARVDVNPSANVIGPHIEPVWTRGTADNATALTSFYQQTPVFFPDPLAVTPQAWTVTWEGALLATPRLSGQLLAVGPDPLVLADPGPQLYDPGSDFCRLGVLPGDLVTLTGCTNDTQCGLGKVCAHGNEGTQGAGGLTIGGLCLTKKERPDAPPGSTTANPGDCDDLLSTVRRYDVTKARPNILLLAPHKDELVRPNLRPCTGGEAPAGDGGAQGGPDGGASDGGEAGAPEAGPSDAGGETRDGSADGGEVGDGDSCADQSDPSTMAFKCVEGHCLSRCEMPNSATGCRAGRICLMFGPRPRVVQAAGEADSCTNHDCFCADGPNLTTAKAECIGELLAYQVNVGRGFLVSGGATGLPITETAITDPTNQQVCAPIPNLDPRNANRISMDAPHCTAVPDNKLDSRCNPDIAMSCPSGDPNVVVKALRDIDRSTDGPNPCLFWGGPNSSDPPGMSPPHVHALFRNQEVQFMMTNLEQAPTGAYQIRFDVHGGFRPQAVIIPPTVEVTMPVRLFLGPVDSLIQSGDNYVGEVPYLFVVDQRRLGRTQGGGPTRGQLLRIHPLGFSVAVPKGMQPWYEDFAHSGNTFPIQ
jgi:hypothetical protein